MITTSKSQSGAAADAGAPVLQVTNLRTTFHTARGPVRAVDGVTLELYAGQTLGLVGESGSGKSVLGRTLMGLITNSATVEVEGEVLVNGKNIHTMSPKERRKVWGPEVAMVFQDPMTSLNPTRKIGALLSEAVRLHLGLDKAQARERAIELLNLVGIPEPQRRLGQYPHELSGGMRQRVMIALALSCEPKLLVADEPTTALDVTVQKQILELLERLATELQMATILISHDLGVVRGRTNRVCVMYGGRVVERAETGELFDNPTHPYTSGLIASTPALHNPPHTPLQTIEGHPPDMVLTLPGCRFAPRCSRSVPDCEQQFPEATVVQPTSATLPVATAHEVSCYRPLDRHEQIKLATPASTPASTAVTEGEN